MSDVEIKCPLCGQILLADDKYLRYIVACGACQNTFIFESICIVNPTESIPVFQPVDVKTGSSDVLDSSVLKLKSPSFFKEFNKSLFVIGITIPNELRQAFLDNLSISEIIPGKRHDVKVVIDDNVFDAHFLMANQKNKCFFWRLQWSAISPIAKYFQNRYKNIFSIFEKDPGTKLFSNCGVWVHATNQRDVFAIKCELNDFVYDSPEETAVDDNVGVDKGSHDEYISRIEQQCSFDKIPDNMCYTKPVWLKIDSEKVSVKSWKDVFVELCKYVDEHYTEDFPLFVGERDIFDSTKRMCFNSTKEGLRMPFLLKEGLWLETNFGSNQILKISCDILKFVEIPLENVEIGYVRNVKGIDSTNSSSIESQEEDCTEDVDVEITSGNSEFDQLLDAWGKDNFE